MEAEKKGIEVVLKCDCLSEVITLTEEVDEGYEDTIYMNVYRMYDHEQTWKSRLKDIWKILRGKQIVAYDFILSKKDLKEKVSQL